MVKKNTTLYLFNFNIECCINVIYILQYELNK